MKYSYLNALNGNLYSIITLFVSFAPVASPSPFMASHLNPNTCFYGGTSKRTPMVDSHIKRREVLLKNKFWYLLGCSVSKGPQQKLF